MLISFWKANGLSTRKMELEEFIHRHHLDAMLIGETNLRSSNRRSLPNYRVYRTDHPGQILHRPPRGPGAGTLQHRGHRNHGQYDDCSGKSRHRIQGVQKAAIGRSPVGDFRQLESNHNLSCCCNSDRWPFNNITTIYSPILLETAGPNVTRRVSNSLSYVTNISRAIDSRAFIPRETSYGRRTGFEDSRRELSIPFSRPEYNQMTGRAKPASFRIFVRIMEGRTTGCAASLSLARTGRKPSPKPSSSIAVPSTRTQTLTTRRVHRRVREIPTLEEEEGPLQPTSHEDVKAIFKALRSDQALELYGITSTTPRNSSYI
ncbi:hypothetical protein Trydic_g1791 [Trypoxylus dichotomus]